MSYAGDRIRELKQDLETYKALAELRGDALARLGSIEPLASRRIDHARDPEVIKRIDYARTELLRWPKAKAGTL